jgi:hypothetical protein
MSKKQEFKKIKLDCEKIIRKNIDKFNLSLENLKKKIAFFENERKNLIENKVIDIQKKLILLNETNDLKFNQNQIEGIIGNSIKITNKFEKQKYSSGLLSGFIFGSIMSILLIVAIFIFFVQQNGMYLNKELFIDPNQYNIVFKSIAFGQDPFFAKIGLGVIFLVLLSFFLFMTSFLKTRSNLKKISHHKKKIGEFELQIGDKLLLIKDISLHIEKYINVLKIYNALLSEESGRLDRIIFFEKNKEIKRPLIEISNIQKMLYTLDKLVSTNMLTEEGVISVDSIGALNNSVDYLNVYIKDLYSDVK